MRTLAKGKQLGNLLKYVGEKFNVTTNIVYSNMNQPLGRTAGMWCEINESIQALKGDGAIDLMEVVFELGSKLVIDSGLTDTLSKAIEMQRQCIDSGNAYDKFEEMVFNQGGYIEKTSELNEPLFSKKVISEKNGFIKSFDTKALGWAAAQIGCGRINKNDNLDNTAGIAFNAKVGDQVNKGDPIMQCFGSDENKIDQAYSQLKEAFQIAEEKVESLAMIFRD